MISTGKALHKLPKPLLSRLTKAAIAAGLAFSTTALADGSKGQDRCDGSRNLHLVNGKIHTMDAQRTVVNQVTIRDGRFTGVGDAGTHENGPCTQTINLGGKTVIPGLIDNHVHFLRLQNLPGYDLRELESVFTIADLQRVIAAKARTVPQGELISTIGGIHPNQFAEARLPTLAELDAAAPNHAVYVSVSSTGPGVVNTLGKQLLTSLGVTVGSAGEVTANAQTNLAFDQLRAQETYPHFIRQLKDEMNYALSKGLTTVYDQAGSVPGAGILDPATGYDPILDLLRNDEVTLRLRLFFPALDNQIGNPKLVNRLSGTFREYGNDTIRIVGVGEWIVSADGSAGSDIPTAPQYEPGARLLASRGWLYQQHTLGLTSHQNHTTAWEHVNADIPIASLHWSLAHANNIDFATTARLKAIGAGVAAHGWSYLASSNPNALAGPPFRMLIDSGIPVGGGSDGARISTLNPWPMIYYMITGKSSRGVVVNAGQQITRDEAMWLYTSANGWFAKEQENLGGIEVGKYGDLVALNRDYFDERAVSDEDIRHLQSALTVIGGQVVYDADGRR
jgi:predicted amidohydrolase YtcJ